MNIEELYDLIQEELESKTLTGEFNLIEDKIMWSFSLESENIMDFGFDDDDDSFSFEATSSEEQLIEAYQEDYDKLLISLDNIEETDNWTVTDYEIEESSINFNIF